MKTKNNVFSWKVWSDSDIASSILNSIKKKAERFIKNYARPISLMEVCGTHTMAIAKSGIRGALKGYVNLVSGPGCPVCVTDQGDIDSVIEIGKRDDVIITTFGDMMKVKGSDGANLFTLRADGCDVRVVYSSMDAVKIAVENRDRNVVFIGIGFETTSPTVAASIIYAKKNGIKNFYVTPFFKLVPPALKYLLDFKIGVIDGFILPGHVSVIIGKSAYDFLKNYSVPSVISGFEPLDILRSIDILIDKKLEGKGDVENEYSRAVSCDGNRVARDMMSDVFSVSDARWRAVGVIKKSGYVFSDRYDEFDALKRFSIKVKVVAEPKGCLCGKILLGIATPIQCPLFAKKCKPEDAVGPCMVSSEGACAAWYKYGVKG
ncbi:MAG: hydrogenase formation protein HypD [Elusimicrobiales bacterium]